jgi:hypothetical protein
MGVLRRLKSEGFCIWPFDPPGWPKVVEIYPRVLTGTVNKSQAANRSEYLAKKFPNLESKMLSMAAASPDAFDAAVSALVMVEHVNELCKLEMATERSELVEGRIWSPL